MACTSPLGYFMCRAYRLLNDQPLAVVALPPQMWQLFLSLPCVNGRKFASKLARLAVTEGLFYYVLPRVQSLSRFATARESPLVISARLAAFPSTQGSLRCGGNYANLKLFGTTNTADVLCFTKRRLFVNSWGKKI